MSVVGPTVPFHTDANGVLSAVYDPTLQALRVSNGGGGGGAVHSVTAGTGINVTGTAADPVVNFADFTGSGSPNGVVTGAPAQTYFDTVNGGLWMQDNHGGTSSTEWVLIAGNGPTMSTDAIGMDSSAASAVITLKTAGTFVNVGTTTVTMGSAAEGDVIDLWPSTGTQSVTGLVQCIAGAGPSSFVDPPLTAWSSWAANNAARASIRIGKFGDLSIMQDTGRTDEGFIVYAPGNDTETTPICRITSTGAVISNAHAAPADAALNNSDHATWLDDTPGATVLHIKAKDSAGTVRTASIPLT